MRPTPLAFLLLLLAAAPAAAQSGINLAWDDCGGHGTVAKTFACNTNSGASVICGSFMPGPGMDALYGLDALVDVLTASSTLPDWWMLGNTECRAGRLALSQDFSVGPFNCQDFWNNQAAVGVGITSGYGGPNRTRFHVIVALPTNFAAPAAAGTEYYGFKLLVTNGKTVGAGACAGCLTGACIVMTTLTLVQVNNVGNQTLTVPMVSQIVTWQGGGPNCALLTPVQARTWGQVKSLYR